MEDHSTAIVITFVLLGTALSILLGRVLRSNQRWAVSVGLPVFAFAIVVVVIAGAVYAQELCDKKLGLCLRTSDTTVWNFVLYPMLCFPVYWLILSLCGKRNN